VTTTALTVGGTDLTAAVAWGSMTCKLNTLDFTLVDPAYTPVIGDAAALTIPSWSGTVVSVAKEDPVDRAGHVRVTVSATNQVVATASAAPFGLSDAPDGSTTYGYRKLKLQTSQNQDGTTTQHGSCQISQAGIWPAMTFLLTSANQGLSAVGFSATNVTVTWPRADIPQYALEFGDPIVTMAVWAASQAGAAPPGTIDGTRITAGTVDTPQLRANAVTAAQILAGSVSGDKLAATLLLASLIKTAAPDGSDPGAGLRVEVDRAGIRAYDASNVLQVNIPTDGSPVYVRGQVSATNLVATASALLQGTALLGVGATMTVQNNVADPSSAPVLVGSVPKLILGTSPAHPGSGLAYDPTGGAGGGTPSFWVGATADDGATTDVAYEYNASTGALLRTLRKTGSTVTYTATLGSTSHVSDTCTDRTGSLYSQVATPLTFPARANIRIQTVSVYMAGVSGNSCTAKNAVWNTSGTSLRESAAYTPSKPAFGLGNSVHYEKSLTSELAVASGATIWAGFLHTASGDWFQWDQDSGSGNTEKRGDGLDGSMTNISTFASLKPNVYVTYKYDVDSSLEGTMGTIVGIARVGTSLWVLDDLGTLFQYSQADLSYIGKTTAIAAYITGQKAGAGLFYDGTNLIVATASGTTGTDQVRLVKCTTGGAYASTLNCSGLAVNGSTATIRGGCLVNDALNAGAPTYWLALGGAFAGVYGFVASTGANTANRDFGLAGEIAGGVAWDGSVFRGWAAAAPTSLWAFTSWDWSSASQPFWLAYAWYDDVGTVHETHVGPRASISLGRRRQLGVTVPTVPAGGADDPDKLNLYMGSGATDPDASAFGNLWLQTTTTATQITLTSFTSSGTHDATTNNFPGGTPAVLRSQTGVAADSVKAPWSLKGDGSKSGFLRFVPITLESLTAGTTPSAGDQTWTPATIPTDGSVYAVAATIGVRESAGGNVAFVAKNYSGEAAGYQYSSGVAGRGGFGTVQLIRTGGTNNVQFKTNASATTNVTIWVYVHGYWTYA
jgi:hypothetical protein